MTVLQCFVIRALCFVRHPSFVFRHPPHIQLRKEECVNISQLFDALTERGAHAVASAGTRTQQNRVLRFVRFVQARDHFARVIGRDSSVVCAGHH